MNCSQVRESLHLYLDGELAPRQELELEAHLLDCECCRREYNEVRQVVDTVRGSKPLYESSSQLRETVEVMVNRAAKRQLNQHRLRTVLPLAAAACLLVMLGVVPLFQETSFTAYAADVHQRYASGKLPLDIQSDQPQAVSSWLESRLTFPVNMPNYPSEPGEAKAYTLTGARLMQYDGEDVAYLAYRMNNRPVSLLVGSNHRIIPAGDDVYRSGNLLFHFSEKNGLKLITWRDGDLVYALVSDVQVKNAQSCVVCHGSAQERSRFENIAPEPR
jgi:anti-sigma factor RsiW